MDDVWDDRPPLPSSEVFPLGIEFTGVSVRVHACATPGGGGGGGVNIGVWAHGNGGPTPHVTPQVNFAPKNWPPKKRYAKVVYGD